MKKNPPKNLYPFSHKIRGLGFTLVELLVSVCIVVILAALILGGVRTMLQWSANVRCISNLRTLSLAVLQYTSDNNGYFPKAQNPSWDVALLPYLGFVSTNSPLSVLRCPNDPRKLMVNNQSSTAYARSYVFSGIRSTDNGDGLVTYTMSRSLAQISAPATTIMMTEWYTDVSGNSVNNFQFRDRSYVIVQGWLAANSIPMLPGLAPYHGKTMNYSFVDGHIESLGANRINDIVSFWKAVR